MTVSASARQRRLRVGVIGCGRMAENHLRFLKADPQVELVGVADTDHARAAKLAQQFGVERVFANAADLLSEGTPDVLHIVTPPEAHLEIALAAMAQGVSVLVEKPVAMNASDSERMLEAARAGGARFCPIYLQLFHPLVLRLKETLRQNPMGAVVRAECHYTIDISHGPPRESGGYHWSFQLPGGILQNYLSHPVYLVLDWIGACKNVSVIGTNRGTLPAPAVDAIDAILEGEKGDGHITMSLGRAGEKYTVRVFFERGSATIDFVTQSLVIEPYRPLPGGLDRVSLSVSRGSQHVRAAAALVVGRLTGKLVPYHGLGNLIQAFYDALRSEQPAPLSIDFVRQVCLTESILLDRAGAAPLAEPSPQRSSTGPRPTVLVTGVGGMLGSAVARQLRSQGIGVRGLIRPLTNLRDVEALDLDLVCGDIRDPNTATQACEGIDVVVHCAAAMSGSEQTVVGTSVEGTQALAHAAEAAGVKKFVHISSLSVFDYSAVGRRGLLSESTPLEAHPEGRGAYSAAKKLAEDVIHNIREGSRTEWIILRPSVIFSSTEDALSAAGKRIGNFLVCFGGRRKRLRMIHVDDVARAVALLISADAALRPALNISHADALTVGRLVRVINQRRSGARVRVLPVPFVVAAGLTAVTVFLGRGRGKSWTAARSRLSYWFSSSSVDSQTIRTVVGWSDGAPLEQQLSNLSS